MNIRVQAVVGLLLASILLAACKKEKMAAEFEIPAGGYPIKVEDSGNKEVDALVCQLVSQRPSPYRDGETDLPTDVVFTNRYCTPEVEAAFKRLKEMGPPIFPALVKHLHDDRYSYGTVIEAWNSCTVGDAIVEVLDDGQHMHCGYKFRDGPAGHGCGYFSFYGYLRDRDVDKWAGWAKNKSRFEIQSDFIDWCIRKENEVGYISDKQKTDLLTRYEAAREKMRKLYSK
jgi:hypothetical protein